jgi:hypothetical protein
MPLVVQMQKPARAFAWRRRKQLFLATHCFRIFRTHVSGTEGCLRRHAERKVHRRQTAAGGEKAATVGKGKGTRSSCQASNAYRTGGFGQEVKGAAGQPAGSRATCTPAPFCASSGGKWCCNTPGQWVVVLLVAWHMQQEQVQRGCRCQRGGWAWHKWQCGHGRLQCGARP